MNSSFQQTTRLPKVAIVRGPWLNPFEMQTYEALKTRYDIKAFASVRHYFDTSGIAIPIEYLHQPLDVGMGIRKWQGLCDRVARRFVGSEERLLGLEKRLALYDIAHAVETYHYFTLQAIRAKQRFGVRVVVTVWENIPFQNEMDPRRANIKAQVRDEADLFLAITQQARQALCMEGVKESRIRVIGAGIDTTRFSPGMPDSNLKKRYGVDENDHVVLFIGSLLWSKGVLDLVIAAKLIVDDPELCKVPVRFLLVGQGPEERRLKSLIRKLSLEKKVLLVGSVPYRDIPDMHRLADIFVLPSIPTPVWQEQFGMVLIESMATGKAIVATHCGAIPEVVANAGIIVPPADAASLAASIKRLLLIPKEREKLGDIARQRAVSLFDYKKVANRIADAYSEVI